MCTVFFDVAYQSYLPSLVERDQLVEGNSKLEISRSASQLAGPGLAGVIVSALGAPVALLLDAISYVASALFLFSIRKTETLPERSEHETRPSMVADAREGLGFVLRNRYLRAISICTASSNFFWSMGGAILVVYAVRELDMSAAAIGAGVLARERRAAARRVHDEQDLRPARHRADDSLGVRALLGRDAAGAAGDEGEPDPVPRRVAAVGGFAAVAYNITQISFRQAICPERMQGRMNAVIRFMVWGTMPVGALLGGALGTWFGLRTALWVAALGALLTFLPILLSPVPKLRELPEPVDELLRPRSTRTAGWWPWRAGASAAPTEPCAAIPFGPCPSYPRSRRGCESSTRSCPPRRSCRRGRRTSRR